MHVRTVTDNTSVVVGILYLYCFSVKSREVLNTYSFSSPNFVRRHKFKELQIRLIVYQVNYV